MNRIKARNAAFNTIAFSGANIKSGFKSTKKLTMPSETTKGALMSFNIQNVTTNHNRTNNVTGLTITGQIMSRLTITGQMS